MNINEIAAGILAGGKSLRMGKNKANLTDAKNPKNTLIMSAISKCSVFPEIMISADSKSRYPQIDVRIVEDEIKGFGPVEGIYQLLCNSSKQYLFVMAVDMPLIDERFFIEFIKCAAECKKADAYVAKDAAGRLQPLCALYNKAIIPTLEDMRRHKQHRIMSLIDRINTVIIEAKSIAADDVFDNINTPLDYEVYKRKTEQRL